MNLESILTSVLISGIMSSLIALYANERIKRIEFNFDFKKYVLRKRIKTYERIEEFITEFLSEGFQKKLTIWFTDPNETTKQSVMDYRSQLRMIRGSGLWISENIHADLTKIDRILSEGITDIKSSQNVQYLIHQDDLIRSFFGAHANLSKDYFIDITKLNNVESFMKSKSVEMHSTIIQLQKITEEAKQIKQRFDSKKS